MAPLEGRRFGRTLAGRTVRTSPHLHIWAGKRSKELHYLALPFGRLLRRLKLVDPATCHFGSDSAERADVEFREGEVYYVLEAKSHQSTDAPNAVHKFFGLILKEVARDRRGKVTAGRKKDKERIAYGILVPAESFAELKEHFKGPGSLSASERKITRESGFAYFRRSFGKLGETGEEFGERYGVKHVFVYSFIADRVEHYRWSEFIDPEHEPVPIRVLEGSARQRFRRPVRAGAPPR